MNFRDDEYPVYIKLDITCQPSKGVPPDVLQAALNRGLAFKADSVRVILDRKDWLFVLLDNNMNHIYTIGCIRDDEGKLSLHS